jgi:hypothetical protein
MVFNTRHINMEIREILTLLILTLVPYLFWSGQGLALNIENRSVTISTSTPSALAEYDFKLTLATLSDVGSIQLQFCGNTPIFEYSCDAPTGLSTSNAALISQFGNTGFTIDQVDSNSNTIILTRTPGVVNLSSSGYDFGGIINPSVSNQTSFVRITTYSSTDASGGYIDRGAVAFSTNNNFVVGAYVPPFLNICVGVTVTDNCSQSQGDNLDMGTLSAQTTGTATSQYAAATNDNSGYSVYVLGDTMTSGNNIIQALTNQTASRAGVPEFGINLRKNSIPDAGSDPVGDGTSLPTSSYDSANLFSFVPGTELSNSAESTDYNLMTVTYIANVPSSQAAGVYSTTLTYLASAQF